MVNLDILSLRRSCANNSTYIDGLSYARNGKVLITNLKESQTQTNVESIVRDSNFVPYVCNFSISNSGEIYQSHCNCKAYKKIVGPCKHIVGTCLHLYYNSNFETSSKSFRIFLDKEESTSYIDELIASLETSLKPSIAAKRPIDIDLNLSIDSINNSSSCSLSFKIGEDKKYVVKSVKNFLNAVNTNSPLYFGKGLTFDPNIHEFSMEDNYIIEYLIPLLEQEQLNDNHISSYHMRYKVFSGKEVRPTPFVLDKIFSSLNNKLFSISLGSNNFNNCKVITEDLPIEFSLSKGNNSLIISNTLESVIPLVNGTYYFYNKNIYKPSTKQSNILKTILKKNTIEIPKDRFNDLSKTILPAIKSISKNIFISKNIEDNLVYKNLNANLFLDKINNDIIAKLEFNYGDFKINPLINSKETNKILVRDMESENYIISILENFSFSSKGDYFFLNNEFSIIEFISNGLNLLKDKCEIYYSDLFKSLKVISSPKVSSSIKITENDLLEISFNMENVNKTELKDIFKSIKLNKKYHRLKDGSFILLNNDKLTDFTNTLDYLNIKNKDLDKDSIVISKYNTLYLDDKFKNNELLKVQKNKSFREIINNFKSVDESDFQVPTSLNGNLRSYQEVGYKWFKTLSHYGFGGILADEMGLGKTFQTIAFLASIKDTTKNPSIVICPTSLVYNWENEFLKFAPHIKTLVVSGNKPIRDQAFKDLSNYDVIITSYTLARIDINTYKDFVFEYCFIDEAQQIKNPSSQTAIAIKSFNTKFRFALTGTPIENSLLELWSIFDFIMPGYLLSLNKFKSTYENPILKNNDNFALSELNKHIKPFILRRRKKDVLKELPDKIEQTLLVELSEEQKKLYASYVGDFKSQINDEIKQHGFNKSKLKILSLLTRLRQLCCDPSIFIENYTGESSKINSLMDILENILAENHRVLIFSQFTATLKNISEKLKSNDIAYMYLDGSTKSNDRIKLVDDFNSGIGKVFLISLKAGGNGLNLTGADTVIHFDPWWNPAVEKQATDRAHRIGQEKTVDVIKLITKGTIEEKIQKLQDKKQQIFDMTVEENSSNNNIISKMSEDDLMEILS